MSLYNDKSLLDAINCIDQQILRYITACENEQHHFNTVEEAIPGELIPRVEELLADDNINGGDHSMSRKLNQGQMGLFYNGNAYLVNYQFAKGVMCDSYRKIELIPYEGARSVDYEGNRLLDMIEDLCRGDMYLDAFAKKYHRAIPLVGKDRLMHGLGLSLQMVADHGFPAAELVDINAYQRGVCFWVIADKKVMDNAMFVFIMKNQHALGFGRPRLEDGSLFAGSPVVRYDVVYDFTLTDPQHSPDRMKLNVKIDLVHDLLPDGSRRVQSVEVDFTPEESAKITGMMKRRFFPADLGVKPHCVPVAIGEEFRDNYYMEYGTPEQKEAVTEKWASTDAGFRRILELSRQNKNRHKTGG